MLKLARTIHFDEADLGKFDCPAEIGEWAVSGGFAFANWADAGTTSEAQFAFASGWLGGESFGRAKLVIVAQIHEVELEELRQNLADHMLKVYDAPSADVAMVAAIHEVEFMQELCEDQDIDTLLAINRVLTDDGVREQYRAIKPQAPNIN